MVWNLKKGKKITLVFLGVFFLLLIIIGFFIYKGLSFYSSISTRSEIWNNVIPKEKNEFNIMLMGYGGPGHAGAYLTDTMMLASVNLKTKRVVLISMPRDIWVKVPTSSGDDFYRKINSVYQMGLFPKNFPDLKSEYKGEEGAGKLLKKTITDITGVNVDYYVGIDFNGFKKAVDRLGSVQVNVTRSFTDPLYPVDGKEDDLCGIDPTDAPKLDEALKIATESPELAFPCRYEVLHFDPGSQTMDGDMALKFVRSRHAPEDGGDFGRARRQQLFLEAIRKKVLNIGFIPKILPLFDDLEGNIKMDVPFEVMKKFLKEAPKADQFTISQLVLTTDNYLKSSYSNDKQYILIPKAGTNNWNVLKRDIKKLQEGISLTPTPTPSP